jgi:sugar/nucleoside kinase (ribokinase family)
MGKVLGMGNALVDVLTRIESDSMLEKLDLPKGSMQLVSSAVAASVLTKVDHLERQQASGGSAANTIHGLANLGIETGFLGKVGKDELGQFFRDDLIRHKISPILLESASATGKALALISPDSERTFATFLGAAVELSADDLNKEYFEGYTHFHIEGYLVQNKDLIRKALELAKENRLVISLDLASFNVVEQNLEFLKEMTEKYVDVLFANEEEAKAFTGCSEKEALNAMAKLCNIAVLKLGSKGSMIQQNNQISVVGVIPVKSIDTTGAGDLYASGFLYGLINHMDLESCGKIGAILSGHVIEVIGPKMVNETWEQIKTKISQL